MLAIKDLNDITRFGDRFLWCIFRLPAYQLHTARVFRAMTLKHKIMIL